MCPLNVRPRKTITLFGSAMTVCFSVCGFFPTVMFTLLGIICGTMLGPFGGINEEAIHTLPSRLQILRRRQLALRHQLEMHQGIIQHRRELMQVFMGFRARHLTLRPE